MSIGWCLITMSFSQYVYLKIPSFLFGVLSPSLSTNYSVCRFNKLVLSILILAFCFALAANDLIITETIPLIPGQISFSLKSFPVINNSETIKADSLTLLRDLDYQLDYRTGQLKLLSTPEAGFLYLDYLLIPRDLLNSYRLYETRSWTDTLSVTAPRRFATSFMDDSKLIVGGSKTFAITFSESGAFDLKQSLFVNLEGALSEDIQIKAQLSDSQSKLSPEGDSKELSSLDKVFISVYGKHFEISMGDLEWQSSSTKFLDINSKFEGLSASYKGDFNTKAGFSAGNGKQSSMRIRIIDGKQGPYYLNADEYQSSYLIVAGSENIYMDGNLLERGSDYYIDYSEGTVMFRRMVMSANQITAYYQYTDENYKQTMLFNSTEIPLGDRFRIRQNIIWQKDDSSSPLLYGFTDADRDSLAVAGDSDAWGLGVYEVEPGNGTYLERMTPEGIVYYEYAANDSTAAYNVYFSYVGIGNGDYEQYSTGKYKYKGLGQGSWLPQKRLIAPVNRNNANIALEYDSGRWDIGAEALYSYHDRNTLSKLDDNDNNSAIFFAKAAWENAESELKPSFRADYENRLADSSLFGSYSYPALDIDLASVPGLDSLAQDQLNLGVQITAANIWTPSLSYRKRRIKGQFEQDAIRFQSLLLARGLIPRINIRSTVSRQQKEDNSSDLAQYHNLNLVWKRKWLTTGFDGLISGLDHSKPDEVSTLYRKLNPYLSLGNDQKWLSRFSFQDDRSEVKDPDWKTLNSSQTYSIRQVTNLSKHTIDLDLSHRDLNKPSETDPQSSKSNYNLIRFRSSHNLLKGAVSLITNYQLNQTEFFPKIRELRYIGDGLGLYDSTGVYASDGDYDYEYITSEVGTLSSELNTQLSLYLKPGNLSSSPVWKKIQSDIIINALEQTDMLQGWRTYLFLPGSVYDPENTMYGKQNLTQNLWVDLIPNKAIANFNLEFDRSLDRRYQDMIRNYSRITAIKVDLKNIYSLNYKIGISHEFETDSRYASQTRLSKASVLAQKNLSTKEAIELETVYDYEQGDRFGGGSGYLLRGLGIYPAYRNVFLQKYRLSLKLGLRYNQRSGSDYLSFLPEKRDGLAGTWNLSAIYRLNSFSSASFEYKGNSYPDSKSKHELKLEFKAEL